jgi:DNA-binding transcriptional ArsR family regulator
MNDPTRRSQDFARVRPAGAGPISRRPLPAPQPSNSCLPMESTSSLPATRHLPDPCAELMGRAEREASFFRVLGNPLRVLAVWLLSERSRTLDEIALAMEASTSAALRHLRILKYSGIVEEHRNKGSTYYRICDDQELRHCLVFRKRPKELLQQFATN